MNTPDSVMISKVNTDFAAAVAGLIIAERLNTVLVRNRQ